MKTIQISASPKQLSKLRNGHRVRVKQGMEGCGFNLIVDPSKFDSMTKSFSKGSAYQIQLTPDEVMANKEAAPTMEGQGIYSGGRVASLKKIGRTLGKVAKKAVKGLETAGKASIKGIRTAEQAVRKNPTSRAIVKKALPILAKVGTQGALMYAGMDPKTAAELSKVSAIGTSEGLKAGGYGLYAGASQGRALPAPPSRMPEKSSLSIGGTLLARSDSQLPPALRSDPMGANFHMNTQLPVQFQRGGIKFV